MPVATETDVIGAMVAHVRTLASVIDKTAMRISATRKKSWNLPAYAVLIQGPFGGAGDIGAGLIEERVDFWAYGPNELTSKVLAARLAFELFRPDLNGPPPFVAAGTRVTDIRSAGGRIYIVDPDEDWQYTVVQSVIRYSGVPV